MTSLISDCSDGRERLSNPVLRIAIDSPYHERVCSPERLRSLRGAPRSADRRSVLVRNWTTGRCRPKVAAVGADTQP